MLVNESLLTPSPLLREFRKTGLLVARDEGRYFAHVAAVKKTKAANHLARVMHLRHQQALGCQVVQAWMNDNCAVIKSQLSSSSSDAISLFRVSGRHHP